MAQEKKGTGARRSKGADWRGKRESLSGTGIVLIIVVGVIAAVAAYLLQDGGWLRSEEEAPSALRISEVMSENTMTLVTETGEVPDWIELENAGSTALDVGKSMLMLGSNINQILSLPSKTLQPGESLIIYADGSLDGGWHAPFRLPASGGDTLVLLNAQGKAIDSLDLPELAADVSYARDADGSWFRNENPSPGAHSGGAAITGVQTRDGALEITEAMTSNSLYYPDEEGKPQDYVEIHNRSGETVNLSGWYLSDSSDKLKRWSFPAINLPAGAYLTVHCSGLNRAEDPLHLHTDFKLSSAGESVYLSRPDGQTVSMVHLPALEADRAYSLVDGEWTAELAPTPGLENSPMGAAQSNANHFGSAGLVINEIMCSATEQEYDWIEIYNGTGQSVNLEGYGLSENSSRPRPRKWQFPSGSSIAPGEYRVICLSGTDKSIIGGYTNANFSLSSAGGYTVTLCDPSGKVLDAAYLPTQYGGISYGRMQGQPGFYYLSTATLAAANSGAAYLSRAESAEASVQGGLFRSGDLFSVELTAPAGSRIYYTLDCSDPDEGSALYTGPITVSSTTILRSRVYRDGMMPSLTDTQSYLYDVQNESGVHVVSLVSDDKNLNDANIGIMVEGYNNNIMQDWEREGHVELFNADGASLISQGCGLKLHGWDSRKLPVKSFKVIARSAYGGNRFEYPIFADRDYQEYQSFLLRVSGEDYDMSFLRDNVLSSLMENTSVMYQETEVAIVYLNGEYYTLSYIRERINAHSVCQFEGWEGMENDIDLVKANDLLVQGSDESFQALLQWIAENDTTTDAAYDYIASQIDVQNFIEYMAMQVFSGNTDTLNVRRYRNPLTDGKWRWILFDLDWSFFKDYNAIQNWMTPGGAGAKGRTNNALFVGLMKNARFRDEYLNYLGEMMATEWTTENILARFEARYQSIEGVLPQYVDKWNIKLDYGIRKVIRYAKERPAKLLGYIQGQFDFSDAQMQQYFGDAIQVIRAYQAANGEVED